MSTFGAFQERGLRAWVRRYLTSIGVAALCLTLIACGSSEAVGPEPLSLEDLLGEYVLVSYEGRPLPTGNGKATYYGGKIVLERKQLYAKTSDTELCGPEDACTRDVATERGTWLLLHDDTLYFDPHQGYSWPPPRIEADGQEIRVYIPDIDRLSFTYRRK